MIFTSHHTTPHPIQLDKFANNVLIEIHRLGDPLSLSKWLNVLMVITQDARVKEGAP